MAKKTINFLIGVMIAGLLAGLVAGRLELDCVDVHPDASWLPSVWFAQCAMAVWLGLTIWLIVEVAFHRFRSIPASPYRRRLAGTVLGGLAGFFVIGMLLPCVSHGTPRGFAGTCGNFMREQMIGGKVNSRPTVIPPRPWRSCTPRGCKILRLTH